MQAALAKVEGVENVEIDLEAKTATVTCESGCSVEALTGALEGTKFSASVQK